MSYNSNAMSLLNSQIGGRGHFWMYITPDNIGAVCASGYVSDAGKKRLQVGDAVFVYSGTLSTLISANPSSVAAGVTSEFASGVVPVFQMCVVSGMTNLDSKGAPTATSAATLQAANPLSFNVDPRNLIDCGDFSINPFQLGTTFNSISTGGQLTADRWCANAGASVVFSVSKQANTQVPGFTQALQWGRSAGDTHSTGVTLGQVLESADCYRVQGLPVTLSFWANAGANFAAGAGSFNALVISGTGVDDTYIDLVSTGWTGAANVISTSITPTTAAVRYGPFTGVVPATSQQLGVVFDYTPVAGTTAGAAEWVQFMGVQLEVGGMTAYEHLDVAYVLEQAQRYLIVMSEGTTGMPSAAGAAASATTAQLFVPLPMTMRKSPTVTLTIGGFEVTTGAGAGQAITGGGSLATKHNPQAVGLLVTTGGTLTAGQGTLLIGRSTGLGSIEMDADYA